LKDEPVRTFGRSLKLKAIERMDARENVSALSRELRVKAGDSVSLALDSSGCNLSS
jgi:hypothetical protein